MRSPGEVCTEFGTVKGEVKYPTVTIVGGLPKHEQRAALRARGVEALGLGASAQMQ